MITEYSEYRAPIDCSNFVYDYADQPRSVSGDTSGVYVYDGNHKRVKSTVGGETTYNVYSLLGQLMHTHNATDFESTDYLYMNGKQIGRLKNGGAETTYLHADHLGSPVSATTNAGAIKWRERYSPFGLTNSNPADNADKTGFTGHLKDDATGLNYMQARYYDPIIGRFLSIDPVGFADKGALPQQFNRYSYTWNNPVNATDPNGEFLNFVVKFAADVALGVAIQVATGQDINLGAGVTESVQGILNPAKTLNNVKKLGKALSQSKKGKCCFVAGTQVLTESGYKNIEDIQLGEKLWAKNTETGEQAWKPVTKVFIEPNRGIYEIKLVGVDGFEQKIQATDDHPFYVIGKEWKTTIELQVGDKIETDGNGAMTVVSVTDEQRQDLTYNFTVADFHTYYVTERNVLVHNCGGVAGGNKRTGSSKNEPHGNNRSMAKALKANEKIDKQIKGIKEAGGKGSGKQVAKLNKTKQNNIKKAQDDAKGGTHGIKERRG